MKNKGYGLFHSIHLLESIKYDPKQDYQLPQDLFEPLSNPSKEYLRIPVDLTIDLIIDEKQLSALEVLIGQANVAFEFK